MLFQTHPAGCRLVHDIAFLVRQLRCLHRPVDFLFCVLSADFRAIDRRAQVSQRSFNFGSPIADEGGWLNFAGHVDFVDAVTVHSSRQQSAENQGV
jgi:hypothetical protein